MASSDLTHSAKLTPWEADMYSACQQVPCLHGT